MADNRGSTAFLTLAAIVGLFDFDLMQLNTFVFRLPNSF